MKKKLSVLAICLVMVIGLLPTVARFAAENCDLYVNGEQFTSEQFPLPAEREVQPTTRPQKFLPLTMQ